jgi:hypothetical protein
MFQLCNKAMRNSIKNAMHFHNISLKNLKKYIL